MVVSESHAQGSGALKPVQVGFSACLPRVTLVIATCLLAGCSTLGAMNPVNWWHKEQGGKIAEDRPPPPGADDPYPNMSTVPAKPPPPDPVAMKTLTDSLVADRTNAQHAAQAAPLADPSSPVASPSLFGVGTAPPPPSSTATVASSNAAGNGPNTASASLPAVNAPAAPAVAPQLSAPVPAPRKAVESAPLETPRATTPTTATQPQAGPAPAVATASAQPALPTEPPPRPAAAGQPPPQPVVPAPMPSPQTGVAASVVFVEGSSSLSEPATDEVKAFAAKRGNGVIVVTGFGDAAASDAAAQSAALTLGLSRAQAVSDTLKAVGVPPAAVRVNAEASGRGAALRLLQ